jgi:osmoprotectant transport system permease protein
MIASVEFWLHWNEMLTKAQQHLFLALTAMFLACAIAVPLGIVLARTKLRWLSTVVIGVVNIIQPIPSLALVALVGVLFMLFKNRYGVGPSTVGSVPGLVALVAYCLLPILRNTYTGIRQVDDAVIEVATGMGMKPRQILLQVELPLAMPFIMTGIRIATVWAIGVATLVSMIGAGGLGDLIFVGLRTQKMDYILAGIIPAIALALVFDWGLGLLERWLTPSGASRPGTA